MATHHSDWSSTSNITVNTTGWTTVTAYENTWTGDSTNWYPHQSPPSDVNTNKLVEDFRKAQKDSRKRMKKKKKVGGVEYMTLYDVYLIYGENRKKPLVIREQVIARDEEDAKVKSGLMAKVESTWDNDS